MAVLPMFPLGTVLFPHAYLPLHVFEERYRRMTRDCLSAGREFGVVLIERGHEVGGGDVRSDLGTVASIVEAVEADDGRWALACIGTRRVDVTRWLDDDPYPRAEVVDRPEAPWTDDAAVFMPELERVVRRSLALRAELGEPAAPIGVELSDEPPVAAWQLAWLSPLGALDRQRVLAIDGPADRLEHLAALVTEECEVLAQRLAGG